MKRHLVSTLAALLLIASASAVRAQDPALPPGHPPLTAPAAAPAAPTPTPRAGALPPGHPPTSAPAPTAGALPPGHPPTSAPAPAAPTGALPPGHPPIAAPQGASAPPAPPASPDRGLKVQQRANHGGMPAQNLPQDESSPAADLPPGEIEALIANSDRSPLPAHEVRLGIMFQKISEGESRSERFARTDANGRAHFGGLKLGSEYSYRVVVKSGPAEYASMPFTLSPRAGQRVKIHVFPVTRDIAAAMVGMRGFIYIEPRDDVFAFDVLYRVFNVGAVTWVPNEVIVKLPEGFKAFTSQAGMSDVAFEAVEGKGARLKGTFSPGQHDVSFRFQLAKEAEPTASFLVGALPRLAELRVIAEASPKMKLEVDGFEQPQVSENQQGKRVLVTRRLFTPGDELAGAVSISLKDIPVPPSGRWYAVAIAAALAALGLLSARGLMRLDDGDDRRESQDRETARELLLAELIEVERARNAGDLGPRAYGDARRSLVDALSRLGADVLSPEKRKRRRAAATT